MKTKAGTASLETYWDNRLSWGSGIYIIGSTANVALKNVFPLPEQLWSVTSVLIGFMMLSFYVICYKELVRRNRQLLGRSLALFLIIYTISAVLIILRAEPVSIMLKHSAMSTFLWWIPSGILACSVCDKKILYSVWVKISFVLCALCMAQFFFHIPSEKDYTEYNSGFGLMLSLALLFHMNELSRKNIWILFLVVFEIYALLVYANRGVLLSIVFFVIYKFAFSSNNRGKKIIGVLFLLFWGFILTASLSSLANYMLKMGVESRTLWIIAEGDFDNTSGRDEIWEASYKMLLERPVLGWGLGGECVKLASFDNGSLIPDDVHTFTPHNGIIHNYVDFGVVFGTIVNLLFIVPFFKLKRYKEKCMNDLLLIFASAIVPCFVSASSMFVKPTVAIFTYLYYFGNRRKR